MSDYGMKIAKPGFDADTAEDKDLIFNSSRPCLKILQSGRVSAVSSSEITFNVYISFPLVILVFLYDSADSSYKPIDAEFDATKLYLPGGGLSGSYYYYYICYA